MFKKYREETQVILPGETRPVTVSTEVRIDPLTGRTARITAPRTDDPPIDFADPPYRARVEHSAAACPFCPERIMERTPRFPPEIAPDGRLTAGESVLFPNRSPYGPYSAVSTFSPAHFIEIGKFTQDHYRGNLANAQDYITRVCGVDRAIRFAAVTQNYLPSAGGTLIHPHLQVNLFVRPTNYLRVLDERSAAYRSKTGRRFWDELVAREEAAGERFVARTGAIAWLTPFAPEAHKEVWAVFTERSDYRELSEEDLSALSRGILAVQRYWRDTGNNGFNLGIYSIAGADDHYRILARMALRTRFVPYARNDRSFFEVILGESATDEFPEKIAGDLGRYFE